MIQLNTFSIVAYDPEEQAWGVAVASKFLAAAAVVSWAQAGAGAVATQALAKVSFGADGLIMTASGMSAEETLAKLIADDPNAEARQVGIVDAKGGAAAYTGTSCHNWAGHYVGDGFTCQGNILANENVIQAMATAYQSAKGELADRLLWALTVADRAGGDKRGKQSAGLMVVRANGGYGGDNDRYMDLRVDDDPDPIHKLGDLVDMHHLFFGSVNAKDLIIITPEVALALQKLLIQLNYLQGDADGTWDELTKQAFWELVSNENLEERWNMEGDTDKIDQVTLDYLRKRFATEP